MKKIIIIRVIWSIFLTSLMVSSAYSISGKPEPYNSVPSINETDLDPLDDVEVTVEIKQIRSLEKFDWQVPALEKIDLISDPDFYVKVFINNAEFVSNVWHNTKYIYDPQWSATLNVPDEEEFVDIKIQLWDWDVGIDKLCDISSDYDGFKDSRDIEITYDLKTGTWFGDDFISGEPVEFDPSGYGRLNGCDDGSIYQLDRDCELWFDIYQTDYDGDNIPYWTEVNVFGTDPQTDNTGEDSDEDGVPIEWEHKWGSYLAYNWHEGSFDRKWFYNPFEWEDHKNIDLDQDGIDNVEEYLTSQWGSDPFRKDIFIELDQMEDSPNGDISVLPEGAKELLRTVFDRQNIVYHLDDGCMGGSDVIPFDSESNSDDLKSIYWNYFLHGDKDNWRRGVFHYGLMVYFAPPGGFVFWGGIDPYLDSYVVSSHYFDTKYVHPKTSDNRNIVYASAYMHECGHTLGIFHGNTPGCDDQFGKFPWQKNFWKWFPYRSVMNYGFMYTMVDYSDGSRGKNDFDDWNRIDLTFFQREMF